MKKRFIDSFMGYLRISPKLFFYQVEIEFSKRGMKLSDSLIERVISRRDKYVMNYLKKVLKNDINTFEETSDNVPKDTLIPKQIWMLWWQGEEDAPSVVKLCISSMRQNNPEWKVTVLSKDNYQEYVQIDEHILARFNNGEVSVQLLSDLIRSELLYRYGGLWADATVFSIKHIPDSIVHYEYYSAKNIETGEKSKYWVDLDLWEGYFIACKKNNNTAKWILTSLRNYLITDKALPDYLLINYLAKIGREEIFTLRSEFEMVPSNNYYIETGKDYLISGDFSIVRNSTTFVVKLNHRETGLYSKIMEQLKDKDEI